jgi:hypothetical protein
VQYMTTASINLKEICEVQRTMRAGYTKSFEGSGAVVESAFYVDFGLIEYSVVVRGIYPESPTITGSQFWQSLGNLNLAELNELSIVPTLYCSRSVLPRVTLCLLVQR